MNPLHPKGTRCFSPAVPLPFGASPNWERNPSRIQNPDGLFLFLIRIQRSFFLSLKS
jgi:hypothetical protein